MNEIAIFPWDDNFNTGLAEVDAQHRRLADLLNQLASLVAFGSSDIEMGRVFDELVAYAGYHFTTEEAIWEEWLAGDPSELQHRETHAAFVDTVGQLMAAQPHAAQTDIAGEALDFLVRWLATHILESDRRMAYLVGAIQQGMARDAAESFADERMSGSTRTMIDIILSIYAALSRNTLRLMRELAERRRVEERLQASQARFRLLVENLPLGVTMMDPDYRILYTNQACDGLFGVEPGQLLGKHCYQEYHRDAVVCANCPGALAMNDRAAHELETQCVRQDGVPLLLHNRAFPLLDDQGRVSGFVEIVEDITARKRNEQELERHRGRLERLVEERTAELAQAKGAAEEANRAKSRFLANMSHELRTPLNAVLGFSEMLAHDPQATPDQQHKLAIINRSGAHLLKMINDVLDLSKIEAGAVELEPERFDLPRMLEDLGQMFEPRAGRAGLRFALDLAPGIARHIEADNGKLRQILINLLGNAVKFTRAGGVALRAGTSPDPNDPARLLLHLEVEDSGPGISPDQLQRIFDPFVQVGERGNAKGTGLGLTITRSFVDLMGGTIGVESEPGRGARFRVELPVALAGDTESESPAQTPRVTGLAPEEPARRILVVEDNRENRALLKGWLAPVGFEVREAENGLEAVEQFAAWRPHLIWMDMRMPVMDGFDATRKIRGLPGGEAVRIVALTAHAFKEQDRKFIEAGCDEVVHKPFRAAEIFDAMARHLGVRYRYAEAGEPAPAKPAGGLAALRLAALPEGLRHALREAAERLDDEAALILIEQVRVLDNEAAEALRALVEEFRFDQILELVERG